MFVSCKHLKVIAMAIVKVIVMAKTKRARPYLSKGLKDLYPPPVLGQGKHYTCAERLLVGQNSGENAKP